MSDPEVIESVSNARIKQLVRLRNRRERDATGVFLVEGYRELSRAVKAGLELLELYVSPDHFLGENEPELIRASEQAGAKIVEVAPQPFAKASYRDRPEGLLAVVRQFPTAIEHLPDDADLVLVVEAIEKPGNLGTMVRTADAAGADAVIVTDPTTDIFNPNVVRASLGALFVVPVLVAGPGEALEALRLRQFKTVASSPAAELSYTDVGYGGRTAILVGSEQYGLSDELLAAADVRVHIPMAGALDSLNAAMASGILLYEAVRQRATAQKVDP